MTPTSPATKKKKPPARTRDGHPVRSKTATLTAGEHQIKVELVLVTPEIASDWLRHNRHNRNIRERRLGQLTGAIKRGEWVLNGETIKFNKDGRLDDGQHRLLAVVEAGRAVPMLIVHQIATRAQETVDTGAARTLGDMLRLRGFADSNNLAAITRRVWQYRAGRAIGSGTGRNDATPQQLLKLVNREADELLRATRFARSISKHQELAVPASIVGSMYLLMAEVTTHEDAELFWLSVADGVQLQAGDGAYALRQTLMRSAAKANRGLSETAKAALTVKAFNAWMRGQEVRQLKYIAGGSKREPFPRIMPPSEGGDIDLGGDDD